MQPLPIIVALVVHLAHKLQLPPVLHTKTMPALLDVYAATRVPILHR